jgi:integrase
VAQQFGRVGIDDKGGGRRYWVIDCRVDGKRFKLRGVIWKSGKRIKFASREQAEQYLADIRSDIRRGIPPLAAISDFLPTDTPEMAFSPHYRRFCEAKGRQQLSAKRMDELRGHESRGHLDALLGLPIHAVTYGALEDWRDGLLDSGLSPKTVHHITSDVRTFLRWLWRRQEIDSEPGPIDVHVPDYAPKIPTPAVQTRILEAIDWGLRGAFLARGYMGLRPSEAYRANLSDYDFERDVLTVYGKGGKVRYLPADSAVTRWVREHHEAPSALRVVEDVPVPLFPNPRATTESQRWTGASARRVMLAAMDAIGVRFKPNEALRHAFGTGAVNRGVALDKAGAYMGHTDPRTTKRYAKLDSAGLRDVTPHRGSDA